MRNLLGTTATIAAAAMLSALALSEAEAQSKSGDSKGVVVTVPAPAAKAAAKNVQTPDPAISKGLAIHNLENLGLGKIEDIVTRNDRKLAIVSVGLVTGTDGTRVVLPLDALKVQNGVIVYNKSWKDFKKMERLGSRDPAEAVTDKDKE